MASISKALTDKRRQDILDVLEVHGTISIEDIAKAIQGNYYTVRKDLHYLTETGKVIPARKDGQTVYWTLKGKSVIPSLLGGQGYRQFTEVIRIALNQGWLYKYPTGVLEEVLAYLYAQPLIAAVGGEIKHNELDYMRSQIDEVIESLDAARRVFVDVKKRVFTDSVAEFESWANDPHYDKEAALNALLKFVDKDTIAHQPYTEAIKREEVSHISVDTEISDQS